MGKEYRYPPPKAKEKAGLCRIPGCRAPRRGADPALARKPGARVCEGHWEAVRVAYAKLGLDRSHKCGRGARESCKEHEAAIDDFWERFDRGEIPPVEPEVHQEGRLTDDAAATLLADLDAGPDRHHGARLRPAGALRPELAVANHEEGG